MQLSDVAHTSASDLWPCATLASNLSLERTMTESSLQTPSLLQPVRMPWGSVPGVVLGLSECARGPQPYLLPEGNVTVKGPLKLRPGLICGSKPQIEAQMMDSEAVRDLATWSLWEDSVLPPTESVL